MSCAVIAFTRRGAALGDMIAESLGGSLHVPAQFAEGFSAQAYESLGSWTAEHWARSEALIFVGACGIAVRAIAPHVRDKFTDPAVVSIDERASFAIPLLSGHVGGANALALELARLTGAQAVISTATDINQLFAVDVWAKALSLAITDRQLAKAVSAALLDGTVVGFASDFGHPCPSGLHCGRADLGIWVTCRRSDGPFPRTLRLVPRQLTIGIGCRRGTAAETIAAAVDAVFETAGLDPLAAAAAATIDLKADEPGLLAFCRSRELPLHTYPASTLAAVPGAFTPSHFVQSVTGVDNVCERAALAGGGELLVPKTSGNGVTVAVALRPSPLKSEQMGE